MASTHHSSVVMLVLLILFAVIHSGGAALRSRAEAVIGARAWRLIFAAASIPSAVVVIGWFLAHRFIPTAAELMRNSALQNLLG